jgi:hypothetical protein
MLTPPFDHYGDRFASEGRKPRASYASTEAALLKTLLGLRALSSRLKKKNVQLFGNILLTLECQVCEHRWDVVIWEQGKLRKRFCRCHTCTRRTFDQKRHETANQHLDSESLRELL